MKNIYFTIAVLFFAFTSCKNNDTTDENSNTVDSTSIQQDNAELNDSLSTITDSAAVESDSADAKSNVNLPNKVSTTTKVIPGEKGKFALAETKWKLVELDGKTVDAKNSRDYFINFDSNSGTFRAFVGCNRINGKYFMKSEGKVGFTDIATTRKMCDNIDVERTFFNNLQKVDNYMIEDNGKMMHLHIGKKAIAKFEAIR